MTSKLAIPMFLLAVLFLSACVSNDGGEQKKDPLPEQQDQDDDFKKEQIKKILYTIPSPMSMAALIKQTGAAFDSEILNDTEKISNYNTASQQALNLGIYGADLSYSSMFDQDNEAILYLSAVQKLCRELDIEGAIDSGIYNRLSDNKENRDSIFAVVSETYFSLDIYLKKNDREDLLALITAGGWIEGIQLAGNHISEGTPQLRQRIAEQKYAADDLVKLMDSYEQNEILKSVTEDIKSVKALFDEVEINAGKTETSTDDNGTTVLGGESSVQMSDETLNKIIERVNEIREKYIL